MTGTLVDMIVRTAKVAVVTAQVGYPEPSVFQTEDGGVQFYWPDHDMLTIDIGPDGEVYAHLVFDNMAMETSVAPDQKDFNGLAAWLAAHEQGWSQR